MKVLNLTHGTNQSMKQKQTLRHRELTCGCQRDRGRGAGPGACTQDTWPQLVVATQHQHWLVCSFLSLQVQGQAWSLFPSSTPSSLDSCLISPSSQHQRIFPRGLTQGTLSTWHDWNSSWRRPGATPTSSILSYGAVWAPGVPGGNRRALWLEQGDAVTTWTIVTWVVNIGWGVAFPSRPLWSLLTVIMKLWGIPSPPN